MEKNELSPDDLNGIATLLHITSEIATNHPKLVGIQRACQRKLDEINMELIKAEAEEAMKLKQAQADQQFKRYEAPKPGDINYVEPEKTTLLDKPIEDLPPVERRV